MSSVLAELSGIDNSELTRSTSRATRAGWEIGAEYLIGASMAAASAEAPGGAVNDPI